MRKVVLQKEYPKQPWIQKKKKKKPLHYYSLDYNAEQN